MKVPLEVDQFVCITVHVALVFLPFDMKMHHMSFKRVWLHVHPALNDSYLTGKSALALTGQILELLPQRQHFLRATSVNEQN